MPGGHQVFNSGQARVKLDVLKSAGDAEAGHLVPRQAHYLLAGEEYFAGLWMVEAVDAVEKTGLAGAVGADNGHYLVVVNIKADIFEGVYAAEVQEQILYDQLFFGLLRHVIKLRKVC